MKMFKKFCVIFLISLFLFVPVSAESGEDKVYMGNTNFVKASEGVTLNNDSGVDLIFNDLGQSAKFETIIYNDTAEVMYVNKLEVNNSSEKFMEFKLDEKSANLAIEPNSSANVGFSINTLAVEGAGRNLDDKVTLNFMVSDSIINPPTFSNILEVLLLFVVLVIAICFMSSNKKLNAFVLIICLFIGGIKYVEANDFISVKVEGLIKYESKNLIETTGTILNGNEADYTNSKDVWAYYDEIKNVTIKSLMKKPKKYYKEFDLSENDNERVLAYLMENGDKDVPYDLVIMSNGVAIANEDSSFLFSFPNTEKVDGLSNVDFRKATTMQGMFLGNEKLKSIDVKLIEMNNAKDTSYMFYNCDELVYDEDELDVDDINNTDYMIARTLYNTVKKDSKSDKNEDFTNKVVNTGKYYIESTKNDEFPIYYYRGNVENNNVIFAGFCWKAVRTTDTGGTKLIYNGVVQADGSCNNSGSSSVLDGVYSYDYGIGGVGYMIGDYGTVHGSHDYNKGLYISSLSSDFYIAESYKANDDNTIELVDYISVNKNTLVDDYVGYYMCSDRTKTTCSSLYKITSIDDKHLNYDTDILYVFGNDVEYRDGQYYLIDTMISNGWSEDKSKILKKYHYTCNNLSSTCKNVYYFKNDYNTIEFSDGEKLETFKASAFESVYDSAIKSVIDNWYRENMVDYTSDIEDTIWCNDRNVEFGFLRSKDEDMSLFEDLLYLNYFGAYKRLNVTNKYIVGECSNKNDRFTVDNKAGNQKLTYPVATITADEMAISGFSNSDNNVSYLNCGTDYWTMSPMHYNNLPCIYTVSSSGEFYCQDNDWWSGIRPMISLKNDIKYYNGNGSITNPYVVE